LPAPRREAGARRSAPARSFGALAEEAELARLGERFLKELDELGQFAERERDAFFCRAALAGVILEKLANVAKDDAFIAFDLNKNGVAAAVFPKLSDLDWLDEVHRRARFF
jgi:hypothetical protein